MPVPSLELMCMMAVAGWPAVSRYYVSYVELHPPDYNTSGVVYTAVPGSSDFGRKVLQSTLSPLTYQVEGLRKDARYAFRAHVGNDDGVGFYPDMQNDPYVSNIVTVLMEDPPLRPRVGAALPAQPDRNTMLELVFQPSDVGGKSSSFFVEYQDCGNGLAPACSDVELAMDDPSRVLVMSVGGDGAMQLKRFSTSPIRVTGLQNNTWYRLRVGASNLAGDGTLSPPCEPVRTLALPAPVTALQIAQLTSSSARLQWTCHGECSRTATFFMVLYSPVSAGLEQAGAGASSSTSGSLRVNISALASVSYHVDLPVDSSHELASSGLVFRVFAGSVQGQVRGAHV
jgi:hypothetical protein